MMIQDIFTNTKNYTLSLSFLFFFSLSLSRESFYNNIHLHRDLAFLISLSILRGKKKTQPIDDEH